MANKIVLIGGEQARHEEALASGTVKPGMLLEMTSASADTVKAHATEGGYAERAFATEDALQGETVDDSYTAGERVSYSLVAPGTVLQAIIKSGEDISKGDDLISAGDGTLIAQASATSAGVVKQIIAVAQEDCDLTASSAVDTLADVRVL